MEKTMILAMATGQKRFSASLCKLVEKYAEILASQGLLTTAMEYLNFMGTEELTTELVILRDCIALSTQPGIVSLMLIFLYMLNCENFRFGNADILTLLCLLSNFHYFKSIYALPTCLCTLMYSFGLCLGPFISMF